MPIASHMQHQQPPQNQIPSALYSSGQYLSNQPTWHEEDSPWKAEKIATILSRNSIKFSDVCEVGCGAGQIVGLLARKYPSARFVGYESAPDAFALCQSKSASNLSFRRDDAFGHSDRFDLAMAIDVVEHVDDYLAFMRNMRRISHYQVYHIPPDLSVFSVLRVSGIMRARNQIGHIHYFLKETALAALSETGHEIVDWFYTAGAIELPSQSKRRKLAAFPRRFLAMLSPGAAARILGGFSIMVLCR